MNFSGFGERFRIVTFGESHGPAVGVVIDGVRPGLEFDLDWIRREMDRRRPGGSDVTTARAEDDAVEVLSGVFEGRTLGTPICLVIRNRGADPAEYEPLRDALRPGHADFAWLRKYGIRDHRGGGRSSGRETAARVAAGAVAKKLLAARGIRTVGFTREAGGVRAEAVDYDEIERNPMRSPDAAAAKAMRRAVLAAKAAGDSVGGIVELHALGVPAGLGDPVFGKLDARIAGALVSIGGVKGVEFGDGFALARLHGSEANDPLGPDGPTTNRAGGTLGGISTGAPIVVRAAVKPTSSIAIEQRTVTASGAPTTIAVRGRHDPCLCPRIVPVAEAMVALVLADALEIQEAIRSPGGAKPSAPK